MKHKYFISLTLALAGVAAGCKPNGTADENPSIPSTNSTSITLQSAKDLANSAVTNTVNTATQAWSSVKESLQSAMGYTYDQRDAFVAKTKDDLQALDQKIQELSDRAASATEATKADLQNKLADIEAKRPALDEKLARVQTATKDDWESAKSDFKSAFDDAWTATKNAWHDVTGN